MPRNIVLTIVLSIFVCLPLSAKDKEGLNLGLSVNKIFYITENVDYYHGPFAIEYEHPQGSFGLFFELPASGSLSFLGEINYQPLKVVSHWYDTINRSIYEEHISYAPLVNFHLSLRLYVNKSKTIRCFVQAKLGLGLANEKSTYSDGLNYHYGIGFGIKIRTFKTVSFAPTLSVFFRDPAQKYRDPIFCTAIGLEISIHNPLKK